MKQSTFYVSVAAGFVVVVMAFLASTAIAVHTSDALDGIQYARMQSAVPRSHQMNTARADLRAIEVMLLDLIVAPPDRDLAESVETVKQTMTGIDFAVATYLSFPAVADQSTFKDETLRHLAELDGAIAQTLVPLKANDRVALRSLVLQRARPLIERVDTDLTTFVTANAVANQLLAKEALAGRRSATRYAYLLDLIAVAITAVVAIAIVVMFRRYDGVVEANSAMIEERADELEAFGERIGHDLLSPLSTLSFCLSAFNSASKSDPKLEEALTHARRCVTRAQEMVRGLFDFARSGGKPEPGRADLREIVEQVAEGVRASEGMERPEVVIEAFDAWTVACTRGVLTSVLSNLLDNAAKFMKGSAVKRITVRARDKGASIRVEVEDTGSGIPTGLERRIFEPYVRAEGATQPGLGLGLSTVKRLCVAYGGSVGARSRHGGGSLFWFTLPKASGQLDELSPASESTIRKVS